MNMRGLIAGLVAVILSIPPAWLSDQAVGLVGAPYAVREVLAVSMFTSTLWLLLAVFRAQRGER